MAYLVMNSYIVYVGDPTKVHPVQAINLRSVTTEDAATTAKKVYAARTGVPEPAIKRIKCTRNW